MGFVVGVGDPAWYLARVLLGAPHEGKHGNGIQITGLLGDAGKVYAASINTRWRAGF